MPPDRVLIDACPLGCDPFRDLVLTFLVDPYLGLVNPVWTGRILDEARTRAARDRGRDRTISELNQLDADFPDALVDAQEVSRALRALQQDDLYDFNAMGAASQLLVAEARTGACSIVVTCRSRFLRGNPFVEVNGPDGFLLDLYEDSGGCDGIMPTAISRLAAKGRMDRGYFLNRLDSCGCRRFVSQIVRCFEGGGVYY